ncbi:FRG domain-containing protein [uncultured Dubosiella sp.]|uniref:FRG domain-containing protein n=1 Tax=uncultured Dubosiella sp. TaxID=1937011 RepID=UPI00272F8417|nr:FRG domain-containing protein [uncultured Dubosiella sp.]
MKNLEEKIEDNEDENADENTTNIMIDSVSSLINAIKDLREKIEDDGDSFTLYFRGQEVSSWKIEPSIFRNDMVSIEDQLMQIPLQKIPMEFRDFNSKFDIMTKYQHYGMCTRLLDLTTNPLVALYFACQLHQNQESTDCEEPDGVIYYTKQYKPHHSADMEVQIVSTLAAYDLRKINEISQVLDKLVEDKILKKDKAEEWKKDENYGDFIDIIQKKYIVTPVYTNERLRKQSGLFLLAGRFTVERSSSSDEYTILKTKKELDEEFEEEHFIIEGENKAKILKELDLLNINEATLFPELEHQLNYIREMKKENVQPVTEFIKFNMQEEKDFIERNERDEVKALYLDNEKLNREIIKKLSIQLQSYIAKKDVEALSKVIEQDFTVDWYKKESAISKIRNDIVKYFLGQGKEKKNSSEIADTIIENIKQEIIVFGKAES